MEPWEVDRYHVASVIVTSVILSSPVWLAAVVPVRFRILSGILRWLGVAVLFFPALIAFDDISRVVSFLYGYSNLYGYSKLFFLLRDQYFTGLLIGVVMMGISVSGIVVLLWPDLRRCLTFCGILLTAIAKADRRQSLSRRLRARLHPISNANSAQHSRAFSPDA
jgi:hypothetical protein